MYHVFNMDGTRFVKLNGLYTLATFLKKVAEIHNRWQRNLSVSNGTWAREEENHDDLMHSISEYIHNC